MSPFLAKLWVQHQTSQFTKYDIDINDYCDGLYKSIHSFIAFKFDFKLYEQYYLTQMICYKIKTQLIKISRVETK